MGLGYSHDTWGDMEKDDPRARMREEFARLKAELDSHTNPFKGCMNMQSVWAQVEAACREVLQRFQSSRTILPEIKVEAVRGERNSVILTFSVAPDVAVQLMQSGVMCSACYQMDMAQVEDTDVEAMNAGYHPRETLKCRKCGEYWVKR